MIADRNDVISDSCIFNIIYPLDYLINLNNENYIYRIHLKGNVDKLANTDKITDQIKKVASYLLKRMGVDPVEGSVKISVLIIDDDYINKIFRVMIKFKRKGLKNE